MGRELLIDKYRPKKLDELSFNRDVNTFMSAIAKKSDMPHLIMEGPRGSGKKLRVELYLREKYGMFTINSKTLYLEQPGKSETKPVHALYSKYHHQFNPSIHNIYDRTLMQCFINDIVHTRLLHNIPYKIIVIEDADLLSTEAQESLRRTLETCVDTCRFIFLVNNEDRIISPLYSRCITVKVSAPTIDEITDILKNITVAENYTVSQEVLKDIAKASGRDLNKAINFLNKIIVTKQSVFSKSEHDDVYRYCTDIIDHLIKGQTIVNAMDKVRGLLYEIVNYCVECRTLLPILLNVVLDKLPNNAHNERYAIISIASERDISIRSSGKDIYHVESFCLHALRVVKSLMLTRQRRVPQIIKK